MTGVVVGALEEGGALEEEGEDEDEDEDEEACFWRVNGRQPDGASSG